MSELNNRIYLINSRLFGWCISLSLALDCWFELFIVHIEGRRQSRYSIQVSLLDIELIKGNCKYDNDLPIYWMWSIKNGVEKGIF